MKNYALNSLGLFILFLITGHTFSYEEVLVETGYTDTKVYYFMAESDFDENAYKKYSSIHLERWPLQILVKYLSKGLNLNLWNTYMIIVFLLIASTWLVINSLKCPDINKTAIFAILLFNPYTFRSYYAIPATINESGLFLGFIIITCGLLNKNNLQIIFGVMLSVISRQTSLLLIPIFITLYYFKYLTFRELKIYCVTIIFGFLCIKYLTILFYGASSSFYFITHSSGLFLWFINSFSITDAISFFGRYILFLLTLSGFILLIDKNFKHNWIFFAIFLFIHLHALSGGPFVTGGNIQRLAALALPFLIPYVSNSKATKNLFIYFIIISVIVSFHHQKTFIYNYNIDNGNILFLLLVLSTLPVSIYLKYSLSKRKINND